jgi:3-oxoacyl-[acyl-carrier protein] reductase
VDRGAPQAEPQDLAEVIVFLLAGGAMVTGQNIVVDGGLTLESR